MSALAPTLEAFLADRLMIQRGASPNTIASYRDAFRLLLRFAAERTGKRPSDLDFSDLDAQLVGAFLEHLEVVRHNSVRTRNNRLAAIHSLFDYAALRHPEHAASIQRVLAIPVKLFERDLVCYLDDDEVDALLGACDLGTWTGRRDQALLDVAVETGLRISELAALTPADVSLGTGSQRARGGKGSQGAAGPSRPRHRACVAGVALRAGSRPDCSAVPNHHRGRMSRDAIERRVALHIGRAAMRCPSLEHKNVGTHTLRHTCAMRLKAKGVSLEIIALILGHEQVTTTYGFYLHADLGAAERAIELVAPPRTRPGRYRASDPLLAFLDTL